MLDQIDKEILELLKENSRMKVKEIAEKVHLSAPTVSQRIINLEDKEIIQKYTIKSDLNKEGYPIQAFIFTTMISPSHSNYLKYIEGYDENIISHYRTAGLSCYLVEAKFETTNELNEFLENLNKHANYGVLNVINQLK